VKESNSQKTVGFLGIDSETHFVKTGDVISNVAVGRIWSDSVELTMNKQKFFVHR
jgi:hypothetical protein